MKTKKIIFLVFFSFFLSNLLFADGYKCFSDYAEGEAKTEPGYWYVHLDMYYSANYDDAKGQRRLKRTMNNLNTIARNSTSSDRSYYVSEFCMKDGTTYRVVFVYLLLWQTGNVEIYQGDENFTSEIPMEKIYDSYSIDGANACNDLYKKMCRKYLDMLLK